MADYNVKLKVDTSQHDAAMEKSAGQVNYYAKRVLSAKDKIMGMTKAIPALTLAVGGATVAMKGMKTILESTDSGFDQVHRTMSVAIQTFDQFKISIATADFSNFLKGLDRIVARAKAAYNAIGDLDMFTLESSLPVAKLQSQIAEARAIINDRDASMEDRKQAQEDLKVYASQLKSIYEQQQQYTRDAFDKNFIAKIGAPFDSDELAKYNIKISEETINGLLDQVVEKLGSVEVASGGESPWQAALDVVEEFYDSWYKGYKAQHIAKNRGKTGKEAQQARFTLGEVYKGYQLVKDQIENMRNIREDEYLDDDSKRTKKEMIQLLLNMVGIETKMYSEMKMLNQASTRTLTVRGGSGGGIDWDEIRRTGLKVEATETELIDSNEHLADEINNAYTERGVNFKGAVDSSYVDDPYFNNQLNSISQTGLDDFVEREADLEHIGEIISQQAEILDNAFAQISNSVIGTIGSINSLGATLGEIFDSEEMTEFFNTMQGGLDVLSQMLSTYQSIIDTIELVNSLKKAGVILSNAQVVADNAATGATLAKTSADSGGAIAAATKSGAKLAFPYNLVAIALGVAAVVGALSMIGKFAEGGIVGGNSSIGDKMIARVNKGEMILNNRQQTRLFNLLDGVGGVNTGSTTSGNVTFRISGGDLVGVLHNQQKKKSRVL